LWLKNSLSKPLRLYFELRIILLNSACFIFISLANNPFIDYKALEIKKSEGTKDLDIDKESKMFFSNLETFNIEN